MQLNAYLNFDGTAEAALEYYRSAIGGELEMLRFEGSPMADSVPSEWQNKVLHGRLRSPAGVLMAADSRPDRKANPGNNFTLLITTENESQADAAFAKLSAGGSIIMPFERTFWGAKFAMVTDKFGIKWGINCPLGE